MANDILNYLLHLGDTLAGNFAVKLAGASALSAFAFFFGELHNQAIAAVAMLMVFDFLTGVTASWLEGKAITSRASMRSVLKSTVYLIAISAAYFADNTIPIAFIETTVVGFVGITEFISILENAGRMGFATPQKLLNQLRAQV